MFDYKPIDRYLRAVDKLGLFSLKTIVNGSGSGRLITISGRRLLNFSSNNYLGLSDSPDVKLAMKEALNKYGMGSGGSRLMTGNTSVQVELESRIAEFKGVESAIAFSTGYMAALGSINPIANAHIMASSKPMRQPERSDVFSDELNHSCLIEGIQLSKSQVHIYKHLDYSGLELELKAARSKRKLVVTESVYSMDGDIVDLPKVIDLCKKYEATLLVDDAHGTGVLGKRGRGVAEYYGVSPKDIDILMGTFTKAFGGVGGFIAGSKKIVDYLRYSSRTYIFTAPISPIVASGLVASIAQLERSTETITKLWRNVDHYRSQLSSAGLDTMASESQILPIFVGNEKKTIELSKRLFELGYFVTGVVAPAVPKGTARLRTIVTAMHKVSDINSFVKDLAVEARKLGIVNARRATQI